LRKGKTDEEKFNELDFKVLEVAYNELSILQKDIINNLVRNLRPDFKAPFNKILLEVFKMCGDIRSRDLANLILKNRDYLKIKEDRDREDSIGPSEMTRAIENLKKTGNPYRKSEELISEICTLFSIEKGLLETGRGKVFYLDDESIKKFKQEHPDIQEADEKRLKKLEIKEAGEEFTTLQHARYLEHDSIYVGKCFAEALDKPYADYMDYVIETEVVYIEERGEKCLVPLEQVSFKEFFHRLECKEQEAVAELIFGLHLVEES